ncbi:MAG: hypothetical protein HY914_02315 [Desulfomonile tiedjei]|nr:hypothetical protein [Desulfomonile tiedjei]
MGLNEREFNLRGEKLLGAELTTWMISDPVRGLGFGRKILEYLQSNYQVLTGMGISEAALKVYLKCGFRWIRHIPRYVKVFSEDSIRRIGKTSPLGADLIARYNCQQGVSYTATESSFGDVQETVDVFHRGFNCFAMDTLYLQWRYANHPVYDYRIFNVRCHGGHGAVILRIENTQEIKIIHVMDIMAHPRAIAGIANFLEDFGRGERADFVDWFCLSERINHVLWYRGWFSVLHDHFIEVPHLYFPLEIRTPPTTSMVVWAGAHLCRLLLLSDFYLTKANNDLDRPTLIYLAQQGREISHG